MTTARTPRDIAAELRRLTPETALPPILAPDDDDTDDPAALLPPREPERPFRERVLTRSGTVALLIFRVGGELFAAELRAIEEAVELSEVHVLPEMSGAMLGAFSLRGRMLPVYSPARALGVSSGQRAAAAILVSGERRIALAIDDVEDVLEVEGAALSEAPGGEDPTGLLLGVLRRDDRLISVIDAVVLAQACLAGQDSDGNVGTHADRDVETA